MAVINKAIIVWTSNSSFIPLDSGFRRNDGKEQCLKFVSPAKAGVQSKGLKRAVTQINYVYPIMDSLVILLCRCYTYKYFYKLLDSYIHTLI
jgi:hypothetical protein